MPARQVLIDQAAATGAELILYGRDFFCHVDYDAASLHFEGGLWNIKRLIPGMKGLFQLENAGCALAALEFLEHSGFKIGQDNAVNGIRSARRPGRLQKFG